MRVERAGERRGQLTVSYITEACLPAGGGQRAPVRAERNGLEPAIVLGQGQGGDDLACGNVPQLGRLGIAGAVCPAARSQGASVRAERDREESAEAGVTQGGNQPIRAKGANVGPGGASHNSDAVGSGRERAGVP